MRLSLLVLFLAGMVVGCSGSSGEPVAPATGSGLDETSLAASREAAEGPYRLWGEWTFFINETHDRVDVVPRRLGRFHLNALKFLEDYCKDCLEITGISNNGDGTINLGVTITHPFPNHPELTGFDVKGIIMFNGSYELKWESTKLYPYPDVPRLSWREVGDPEVLNPDGYIARWSPWWDSGSSLPIFNYWPGKYSNGTPTANINAYLNFYTDENRHMFRCNHKVHRTYHIWLPPGPVVAGYAVEACWEPPIVTPVTDPANDFPYSANQPEPYFFDWVINEGKPITSWCCNGWECKGAYVIIKAWYDWFDPPPPGKFRAMDFSVPTHPLWMMGGSNLPQCPGSEDKFGIDHPLDLTEWYPDGTYRGFAGAYVCDFTQYPYYYTKVAYDVFDFVIDLE